MTIPFLQSMIVLLTGIVLIVVLTTKYKIHAFFALIAACLLVGLGLELSLADILATTKTGFGNIIGALGLIIVFGTTLGIILEHTGATVVLANAILKLTGQQRAASAMNITGYVVGLPIFCDSGYIVLSSLNNNIAARTGTTMALMAASLASGLYAVHCLIPPHPGAAAATATLSADFGLVVLYGMLVAIPTAFCGFLWAKYATINMPVTISPKQDDVVMEQITQQQLPSVGISILPIAIPILLIGIRSFITVNESSSFLLKSLYAIGAPEVALGIGILLAIFGKRNWKREDFNALLRQAVEKAGDILLIIGAGGAFGALIAQVNMAEYLSGNDVVSSLGLFFPFIVASLLKTAQGSSSVAIITTATMVLPMLSSLGLDHTMGKVCAVLAMGAGSMMVSHANDSYFWVISRFSGIGMSVMLRVYTVATLVMGIVAIGLIYLLYLVL
ncbi:GntP family permease [Sphingobacterium chuzhouense]|uniref:GntP family permease n=1 Tax=Sphingobacterium chuzhouense TaxID=1742264 RepID=A0ABR7XPJ5_9SPHI|nr:GntP family permease [Sphingobacterium chuzhouense]MBD1421094.1 GntP family permease [Sphingobacterium chuzhouense]